jgi:peptidoglycan/xylan/chitin deacetylase (PgdA/CDA1 family)
MHTTPGPPRDFVGYGASPPQVRWPNDARLALNIVVNYEEGAEYSIPDGDDRNETGLAETNDALEPQFRDLRVESVYEYGSRAGVWRLLRLFEDSDVPVTFFACAVAIERNLAVGQAIREAGHEVCSHGWRWSEPWLLEREEERKEIRQAVASLERTCGERPAGWYCRYGPSVNTRELLVEEGGFLYDSDAYNDDLPYFVDVQGQLHLVVPYTLTYNDIKFVLPQGFGSPSDFFDYCRRALDELHREGEAGRPKMMSIGLHARLAGQPGRVSALRELLEYAQAKGGVWLARRADIARWWLDQHETFAP